VIATVASMSDTNTGEAIRSRRRQLGMGQADLAAAVGVSRNWISNIERGQPCSRSLFESIWRTLGAENALDALAAPAIHLSRAQATGKAIHALRKSAHPRMTQKDLADRVGITRTYLSQVEVGRLMPSLDLLVRICDAFGGDSSPVLAAAGCAQLIPTPTTTDDAPPSERSLRDDFAIAALPSLLVEKPLLGANLSIFYSGIAHKAYRVADAMLVARSEGVNR
jgi:transcriptional regulator with XRE-family HTH domain